MTRPENAGDALPLDSADFDIEALLESMRPPSFPREICEKHPKLQAWLTRIDRKHTLSLLAGLQATPEFHANTCLLYTSPSPRD